MITEITPEMEVMFDQMRGLELPGSLDARAWHVQMLAIDRLKEGLHGHLDTACTFNIGSMARDIEAKLGDAVMASKDDEGAVEFKSLTRTRTGAQVEFSVWVKPRPVEPAPPRYIDEVGPITYANWDAVVAWYAERKK